MLSKTQEQDSKHDSTVASTSVLISVFCPRSPQRRNVMCPCKPNNSFLSKFLLVSGLSQRPRNLTSHLCSFFELLCILVIIVVTKPYASANIHKTVQFSEKTLYLLCFVLFSHDAVNCDTLGSTLGTHPTILKCGQIRTIRQHHYDHF